MRLIYQRLTAWLADSARKPLLLRGARQVGKTHSVRAWANEKFGAQNILEINLEERKDLRRIFEGDLRVERIIQDLFLATNFDLNRKGTLLFLDEIQACPEAITALRYFYEKLPNLPVIAAGSLLDLALDAVSFPVGRVQSLFMHPLTFTEFLEVIGNDNLRKFIETLPLDRPLSPAIHDELLRLLKLYFYVGGMPEAVFKYAKSENLASSTRIHSELIETYRSDFLKYSKRTDWDALEVVFRQAPYQVANSGWKYKDFDKQMRPEKIRRALNLLALARLIHKVRPVFDPRAPLSASSQESNFKMIFLDIGLMQAALGFDWSGATGEDSLSSLLKGRLAEQFVGQRLIAHRSLDSEYALHYWYRNERGSSAEVDYLVESQAAIAPLEVKSGSRGSLKSLTLYEKAFKPQRSIILSTRNLEVRDQTCYFPLYLACRV